MRLALVANPNAGGGFDPEALGLGGDVVLARVEELERLAPDRIAVAGGDGSIAPVAAVAERLDVPLAVIPAGTANDFARANGLPLDLRAAAELALHGTRTRRLELGRLADATPFVNVASAGLATVAARQAQPLKPRLGALAYAAGALRAAATAAPLPARVRIDGNEVFAGRAWQVIVACTGAFGGGAGVGATDPADGELDVVVLAGSRLGLARHAAGLRRQTITPHGRGTVVEIELPPGTDVNCDGELRRGGLERVTARAAAYALLVPGDDSP